MDLPLKIQMSYNQLTKSEKKIADYILINKEKVIYMSITELANDCEVGETSVYRFCRTLEFGGYQEFKMQLSLYLASNENGHKVQTSSEDTGFEKRRMQRQIEAIEESYHLLDKDSIMKIVKLIEEADSMYFFCVGDSLQTAHDIWNQFIRITPKVRIIEDAHMQAMATSMLTERSLIFLVSYSGATKDIVNIAKIAKNNQVKIAGITRYKKSPLTAYTDEVLLCGGKESPLEGGDLTVKMSQLYLLDLLYHTYYQRNRKQSLENQHKSSQAVVDKLL